MTESQVHDIDWGFLELKNLIATFPIPENLSQPPPTDGFGFLASFVELRVYGSMLYLRDLVHSFQELHSAKPNAFHGVLLVRAAIELAGVSYFLRKHIGDCFKSQDMNKALEWARRGMFGNRFMDKFGASLLGAEAHNLPPIEIGSAMTCFSNEVLKDKKEKYEHLSELSHPNGAALLRYISIPGAQVAVFLKEPMLEPLDLRKSMFTAAYFAFNEVTMLSELCKGIKKGYSPSVSEKS